MVITSLPGTCCLVSGTAQDRGRRILTSEERTWDRNCQTGLRPSFHLPKSFIQAVILQGTVQKPNLGEPIELLSLTHKRGWLQPWSTMLLSFTGVGFSWLWLQISGYLHVIWYPMGLLVVWWHLLLELNGFFFFPFRSSSLWNHVILQDFSASVWKQGFHPGYCRKVILPGLGSSRRELKMPSV